MTIDDVINDLNLENYQAVAIGKLHQDSCQVDTCLEKTQLFESLDLKDLKPSGDLKDFVAIRIRTKTNIEHTLPKIDRCCKLNGRKVEWDGIDDIPRINCDYLQEEFNSKYVMSREAVMLQGCQTNWKAREWTFNGLLQPSFSSTWQLLGSKHSPKLIYT
jgi:hypothetical protein